MKRSIRLAIVCLLASTLPVLVFSQAAAPTPAHHTCFHVTDSTGAPLNGRLLLFLKSGSGAPAVDADEFSPSDTWVTATDVHNWQPGTTLDIDADQIAFPSGFSQLTPGTYQVQAVLDPDHSYPYSGRDPHDWVSSVLALTAYNPATSPTPTLILDHHPEVPEEQAQYLAKTKAAATPDVARLEEFESPRLTAFWGHSTKVRAWVILPPGYDENSSTTYPTLYWTHGFGGNPDYDLLYGILLHKRMVSGKFPPMICVMLDEAIPPGHPRIRRLRQ